MGSRRFIDLIELSVSSILIDLCCQNVGSFSFNLIFNSVFSVRLLEKSFERQRVESILLLWKRVAVIL